MSADKPQPRRQVARGRDDGTLGTADVRDQRLAANARRQVVEQADILPDRRCEHDQIGAVRECEVVPSGVSRVPRHSASETTSARSMATIWHPARPHEAQAQPIRR